MSASTIVVPSASWPQALRELGTGIGRVVVHDPGHVPDAPTAEHLAAALRLPLVASAGPVAVGDGDAGIRRYGTRAVVAPVRLPDPRLVALDADAVSLVGDLPGDTWEGWLAAFARRAEQLGMRHVAVPGVSIVARAGQPASAEAEPLLEAAVLEAALDRRPAVVFIDGSCLLDRITTGTHVVILEMAAAIARARNGASVAVVAPPVAHPLLRQRLGPDGVRVLSKQAVGDAVADLVLRPYQLYSVGELTWCRDHGRRLVIAQLDLIAYSNPDYYPRESLFHEIRNLIRASLRTADGIMCISGFGRDSVLGQITGLDPDRVAVVPCGTDHLAPSAPARPAVLPGDGRFVLCLSGAFWHKNRPFAARVFAAMRHRGYDGRLVFVGSQPYSGNSSAATADVLAGMRESERDAVLDLGVVDEDAKWWLLEHADLVLYPSTVEGFGLVPFEAAAVGTPTAMHRSTAFTEWFGDRVGLDRWDVEEWADLAMAWTADADRAARDAASIAVAGRHLTWAAAAESWWSFADRLVSMPRRDPTVGRSEGGRLVAYPRLSTDLSPLQHAVRFARRCYSYARRRVRGLTG